MFFQNLSSNHPCREMASAEFKYSLSPKQQRRPLFYLPSNSFSMVSPVLRIQLAAFSLHIYHVFLSPFSFLLFVHRIVLYLRLGGINGSCYIVALIAQNLTGLVVHCAICMCSTQFMYCKTARNWAFISSLHISRSNPNF